MSSEYFGIGGSKARLIGAVLFVGAASLVAEASFDGGFWSSSAVAQQGGQGSGGPNNSGGSGPNNEGTGSGGQGTSTGPGTRNRAGGGTGGGGGGNVPTGVGTSDGPLVGGGDKSDPAGAAGADWCATYKSGEANTSKRVSGENLKRLDAARLLIAPEINKAAVEKKGFPIYNLALYQEVFEDKAPDAVLAGTYLGLSATAPVSEAVVKRVNGLLCVGSDDETVAETTRVAEQQRLSMQ